MIILKIYILEPRITRSTCEPNELDKKNFIIDNTTTFAYANANIQFKENKNILIGIRKMRIGQNQDIKQLAFWLNIFYGIKKH